MKVPLRHSSITSFRLAAFGFLMNYMAGISRGAAHASRLDQQDNENAVM
jgi:hypothetical protein